MNRLLGLWLVLCLFASGAVKAQDPFLNSLLKQQPTYLKVDEAFVFDFSQRDNVVELQWQVQPGYYLYRDKVKMVGKGAELGEFAMPQGLDHEDEYFGKTQVYFGEQTVRVAVPLVYAELNSVLKIRYQGCAEQGLCYPPVTMEIPLIPVKAASTADSPQILNAILGAEPSASEQPSANEEPSASEQPSASEEPSAREQPSANAQLSTVSNPSASRNDHAIDAAGSNSDLLQRLQQGSWLTNLLLFFVLGIGLAFTPCVFPMFPILSGIIAGQRQLNTKSAFWLSLVYVQGMAVTYALLGLVVASFGAQVQGYLQHPAVLIGFSLLFVALALSMFGWYEFKLPTSWLEKVTALSNQQRSGNAFGVFVMGVLSGLIASPCTTAPLSAALIYVAQSGDYVLGAVTLYVLSLGMGLPLLLLGTSGGKLLPKAGAWMDTVKNGFGVVMLLLPVLLLERIVPVFWSSVLYIVWWLLAAAFALSALQQVAAAWLRAGLAVVALLSVLFAFELIKPLWWPVAHSAGASQSNVSNLSNSNSADPALPGERDSHGFYRIDGLEALQAHLEYAKAHNKTVLLDLYADWCVACKEFEKYTFSDANVAQTLAQLHLVNYNMTDNSLDDVKIMERYRVAGLPTLLFLRGDQELARSRVVGFMNAKSFDEHVKALLTR